MSLKRVRVVFPLNITSKDNLICNFISFSKSIPRNGKLGTINKDDNDDDDDNDYDDKINIHQIWSNYLSTTNCIYQYIGI